LLKNERAAISPLENSFKVLENPPSRESVKERNGRRLWLAINPNPSSTLSIRPSLAMSLSVDGTLSSLELLL
jgi:hypothetical protein